MPPRENLSATAHGRLIAVNRSKIRTDPKTAGVSGELVAGYGLVGDAHAGLNEREVALIAVAEIEACNREHQLGAVPGSFADNLTIAELDLTQLQIGDQLCVGPTRLKVVQLGKPRSQAHSYNFKGHSILPDVGIFCRVLEGGHVQQGDTVTILPAN